MGIKPTESFVTIYHEDMQAARQFYEGVLGLEIREVTYDWFIGYWLSGRHEMALCISSSPDEGARWRAGGKAVVIDSHTAESRMGNCQLSAHKPNPGYPGQESGATERGTESFLDRRSDESGSEP